MNEVIDFDAVDIAVKKWLEALTGGDLMAVQHGDQPDTKKAQLLFNMISAVASDFGCEGYDEREGEDDEGELTGEIIPIYCTVQEYILTYQVDAIYCRNNIAQIIKIVKQFKSKHHHTFGNYSNLAYRDNSVIRRVDFKRNNKTHFKTTVDIDFVYRCKVCTDINTIEIINIQPCDHLDFVGAIQVSKP